MNIKVKRTVELFFTALLLLLNPLQTYGWHDKTHLAIARAAGFDRWYSAAAPDVVKSREVFRKIEEKNHYFNNNGAVPVSEVMVMEQLKRFNEPDDQEGHLYGAIIGSLRDFRDLKATGKYADYPLVFAAHYIADLSMPLHNSAYDAFNRERHSKNDGIIEGEVLKSIGIIRRSIYRITLASEADLAREVARVAEISRKLGNRMRMDNRDMSGPEAFEQAVHSASLFRAILLYVGKPPEGEITDNGNMK
ncbi:hypothetical protein [Chlorobium ferrooxidans]|uniref:Phospholipase C/D domain-containing protein n=1 Tax=Chlorobium ferrooxidans DSM 13031 TaxID=377431 RepID=Q0YRL4_9CHLB|nr:hypothetical protein [Chlorobium ferrooxidans]EAT58880.1 conserved hypothetical protein [Chlorobium ferrooxidans DSM 13031]